jgi:hypothetical protein
VLSRALALVLLIVAPAASAFADFDLARVRQGVVRIVALPTPLAAPDPNESCPTECSGSGFILNEQGTIATNHHVVDAVLRRGGTLLVFHDQDLREVADGLKEEATRQQMFTALLPRGIRGEVAWFDAKKDLALVTPQQAGRGASLVLAPARFVQQLDRVRGLGYAGINSRVGSRGYLTLSQQPGEISSSFTHDKLGARVYHISATIYHGMSGGPLVNECGEVVGVDGAASAIGKDLDVDRADYSIHVDELFAVLDSRKIAYRTTNARCATERHSTGGRESGDADRSVPISVPSRDPLLTFGVIAAVLLGVVAVALALTSRGRQAVKAAADSVSQRLGGAHKAANKGGAAAGAGDGAAGKKQADAGGAGAPPRPSEAPLLYGVSGEYAGVELELGDDPVVLGRDPRVSQLVFSPDTPGVSGRHCSIRFDPERQTVLVEDLWSSHGTFLVSGPGSGERLSGGEPRPLRSADQFYLADPDVLFEVRY